MNDVIKMDRTAVADSVTKFRRIVTGHTVEGEAVFVLDEVCQNAHAIMGHPTFATTELWKSLQTPADNSGDFEDPAAGPTVVAPPKHGTVFRVVEFAPDKIWREAHGPAPMMHRTPSLDYAMVLKGEIYAVLDKSETLMKPGDVLIQRGTNHAWSNRTDEPCLVLFVLIGAEPLQ